jgi:hypothetical protein
MEKLRGIESLKVGDVLKVKCLDKLDFANFGCYEAVFRITHIKGYVFGKLLNTRLAGREWAFYLNDKTFYRLDEQEAILYDL